jgi:hypothetical protein
MAYAPTLVLPPEIPRHIPEFSSRMFQMGHPVRVV